MTHYTPLNVLSHAVRTLVLPGLTTTLLGVSAATTAQITYNFDNTLACKFRGFIYYYTTSNQYLAQAVPNINPNANTLVTLPANADRIYGVRVYPFPSGATENAFYKCAQDYPPPTIPEQLDACRTTGCSSVPIQPCAQPVSNKRKPIAYTGSQAWSGWTGQTVYTCSSHTAQNPLIGGTWEGPCCNNRGLRITYSNTCP